jgi:response regulator of citrate/malate metabolism
MVVVLTSTVAPGIKRRTLTSLRRVLVEHDGPDTAEAWAYAAGISTTCARKYLEWMVGRDEALASRIQETRKITLYEAI